MQSMEVIKAMAEVGNPNSVSDAGVGCAVCKERCNGCLYELAINAAGYNDKAFVNDIIAKGKDIENKTIALETAILKVVNEKIGV